MSAGSGADAALEPIELPQLPDDPLVSVLTASHNGADHLRAAVDTVLGQTHRRVEHVIIDDGSRDGTRDLLVELAAEHPTLTWASIEHGGQTEAMNAAFARSNGEVVLFLDADDQWVPTKVQRCLEAFRERPRAGIVTHKIAEVTPDGTEISVFPPLSPVADGWLGEQALVSGGEITGMSATSAMGLRREVAQLLFPFRTVGDMAYFDVLVHGLAPLLSEVVGIDEPLTRYLWHGSNVTFDDGLSPDRIERMLRLHGRVWELQHELLSERDAAAAARLRPFEESRYAAENRYMLARLRGDHDGARAAHETLRRSAHFDEQHPLRRAVWLAAPRVPDRLYVRFMTSVMTPGGLRRHVASARRWGESVSSLFSRS